MVSYQNRTQFIELVDFGEVYVYSKGLMVFLVLSLVISTLFEVNFGASHRLAMSVT